MNLSEIQGLSDRDLTRVVGQLTAGHPHSAAVRAVWALEAEVIRLRAELASAREREGKLVSAHETSQRLRIDQTERMAELERELANERSIHEQVRDWWEEQAQLAQRLYRERDAAVATAEALREVLASVEWSKSDGSPYLVCPSCGHFKGKGHADDCRLAAALADTPGTDSTGGETT